MNPMSDDKCVKHATCCCNVARAFAMMALAIYSSNVWRGELSLDYTYGVELDDTKARTLIGIRGFELVAMEEAKTDKLRQACLIGQVTVVAKNPEPYRYLTCHGDFGSVRTVVGVWLEKKASWYGKKVPVLAPSPMKSRAEMSEMIAEIEALPFPDDPRP